MTSFTERIDQLKVLLPGLKEPIIEFLAADNALPPWSQSERTLLFSQPLRTEFRRFRIDRDRVNRILHWCGAAGAKELKQVFYYHLRDMDSELAREYAVAAEIAKDVDLGADEQVAAAVAEVNDALKAQGEREPVQLCSPARLRNVINADRYLSRQRLYTGTLLDGYRQLMFTVRKMEHTSPPRSPAEALGRDEVRRDNPHVVYENGLFGDGTLYFQERDPNHPTRLLKQGRKLPFEPIAPELFGKNKSEVDAFVQDLVRRHREKKEASMSS